MSNLPDPPIPREVDLRGFPGFMIDVDRLLASELVALGTPEEKWGAFMLWCRAWQQSPPGSLPQDERVLAAFSGAGARWQKIKSMALRGFILCSDGRLYHSVLCEQVITAWKKRQSYRNDQERLRSWRKKQKGQDDGNGGGNDAETRFKTQSETPPETVREPVEGEGEGKKKVRKVSSLRSLTGRDGETRFNGISDKAFEEDFWPLYPRKEAKGYAKKAWISAIRKASAGAIVEGCRNYKFSPDPRFVPYPATWLNGEYWLQATENDGMDPTLRAAGVTQAMLDEHLGSNLVPLFGGKLIQ